MAKIEGREDFEEWLNGIPDQEERRRVAIALATRATLRVLPALETWLHEDEKTAIVIVLPAFHTLAAALATAKGPAHDAELVDATHAAITYATAAVPAVAIAPAADAARAAALAAAFAAANAAARPATFAAARAVTFAPARAAYAYPAWEALEVDISFYENENSISALLARPLWPDGTPQKMQNLWASMKHRLLAREGEHWEVWTNWYDARLDPDTPIPCYNPPNEELERARVLLPEELWKKGPAAVNAEIKRLIAKYHAIGKCPEGGDGPGDEEPEIPNVQPATIVPVWEGERLSLPSQPVEPEKLDREALADALRAMREQMEAFAKLLRNDRASNALDPRVIAAIEETARLIPESGEIPRHRLMRLAEQAEELEDYLSDASEEEREGWPEILRKKGRRLFHNFSRILDRFAVWRETKAYLAEEAQAVDAETVEKIAGLADTFATDLEENFEPEKLDPEITRLLREMGQHVAEMRDAAMRRGKEAGELLRQRVADVATSITNILKRIAQRVAPWLKERAKVFGNAATDETDGALRRLARFLVKWGERTIKGGAIGLPTYVAHKLGWLSHFIQWLKDIWPGHWPF